MDVRAGCSCQNACLSRTRGAYPKFWPESFFLGARLRSYASKKGSEKGVLRKRALQNVLRRGLGRRLVTCSGF